VPEDEVRPNDVPQTSLTQVRVAGNLSAVSTEFVFRGRIIGEYERECDRCLEPAHETVEQEVTWLFEPGTDTPQAAPDVEDEEGELEGGEDEERARYYHGEEIDLAPHVWEEVVLATPTKFYCRDDCRGLCPRCGKNLNAGACDCAPEKETNGNSGLAALKDMFPDLPSKPVEE
jgi:uncharacterized protein